jgi:DnaK suppressor protein
MLTEADKALLKSRLMEERSRLLRNAQEGLSFAMNRERTVGRDSIDESMEEEIFSTELRLRDREKWLLGKVAGAIERLESGDINECEDCGGPIGVKRLLARPVTTLCIECKEEREREEAVEAQVARGAGRGGIDMGDEMPGGSGSSMSFDE